MNDEMTGKEAEAARDGVPAVPDFVGDSDVEGSQGRDGGSDSGDEGAAGVLGRVVGVGGLGDGSWRDAVWITCRDGKARPVEPVYIQTVAGVPVVVGLSRPEGLEEGEAAEAGVEWHLAGLCPLVPGGVFKKGSGHPLLEGKNRIGMLKGYGNAIVPEVAAMFIRAFMEIEAEDERALLGASGSDLSGRSEEGAVDGDAE